MEDVLEFKRKYLRGFISPEGFLIRVTSIELEGSDPVEIIAESIVRNVERCTSLMKEIGEFSKREDDLENRSFQHYLIEKYGYVYIAIQYLDHKVEVEELVIPGHSKQVNELQRKRILQLLKEEQPFTIAPKILEKK